MWTFKSEIERISKERAAEAAKEAARDGYLTGQQDSNRMIAKRMVKHGMSFEDIAYVLDITEAEAIEYVNS